MGCFGGWWLWLDGLSEVIGWLCLFLGVWGWGWVVRLGLLWGVGGWSAVLWEVAEVSEGGQVGAGPGPVGW